MANLGEIKNKFKEIGLETESERETFTKALLFNFEYKNSEYTCIQNTFMDDSTIDNLKSEDICPTGTKSLGS